MKKTIVLLVAVMLFIFSFALEKEKVREVGIVGQIPTVTPWSYYGGYNYILKFGDSRSVTRFSSLNAEYTYDSGYYIYGDEIDTLSGSDKDTDISLGFAIGREYRKEIAENFEFRYGGDILLGYLRGHTLDENDNPAYNNYVTHSLNTGFQLVLGFNYVIKEKFIIGIEINPKAYYKYSFSLYDRNNDGDIYYRENGSDAVIVDINNNVLFSLLYRF